jgi:hypothetical protein
MLVAASAQLAAAGVSQVSPGGAVATAETSAQLTLVRNARGEPVSVEADVLTAASAHPASARTAGGSDDADADGDGDADADADGDGDGDDNADVDGMETDRFGGDTEADSGSDRPSRAGAAAGAGAGVQTGAAGGAGRPPIPARPAPRRAAAATAAVAAAAAAAAPPLGFGGTPASAAGTALMPFAGSPMFGADVPAPAPSAAAGGGIPGELPDGEPADEIYYMGIIDILQQYDLRKMGETVLKSVVHPISGISSVSPAFYAERFVKFLSEHTR